MHVNARGVHHQTPIRADFNEREGGGRWWGGGVTREGTEDKCVKETGTCSKL